MEGLDIFKKTFDPKFELFLSEKTATTFVHQDLEDIGRYLKKLAQGGKRIRPYVTWLAYRSVEDEDDESIYEVLYALELFQLFALVHDDIIDRAKTRHHVACLHVVYGIDQAILVGDLLLAWAMEVGAKYPHIASLWNSLAQETIIGQMLDVSLVGKIDADEALLRTRLEFKTAKYTFAYPIEIGLALAGTASKPFTEFGMILGSLFQELDDVADVLLDTATLGKEPCLDMRMGVPTYLTHYVYHHGTAAERAVLAICFGNKEECDYERIKDLFIQSGAVKNVLARSSMSCEHARVILRELQCSPSSHHAWIECITYFEEKISMLAKIAASNPAPTVPSPVVLK